MKKSSKVATKGLAGVLATVIVVVIFILSMVGIPFAKDKVNFSTASLSSGVSTERKFNPRECKTEYSIITEDKTVHYIYNMGTIVKVKDSNKLEFSLKNLDKIPEEMLEKDVIITAKYGEHKKLGFNILHFIAQKNTNYSINAQTVNLFEGKLEDFKSGTVNLETPNKYYVEFSVRVKDMGVVLDATKNLSAKLSVDGKKDKAPILFRFETIIALVSSLICILGYFMVMSSKSSIPMKRGKKVMYTALLIPIIVIVFILATDFLIAVVIEGIAVGIMALICILCISFFWLFF